MNGLICSIIKFDLDRADHAKYELLENLVRVKPALDSIGRRIEQVQTPWGELQFRKVNDPEIPSDCRVLLQVSVPHSTARIV